MGNKKSKTKKVIGIISIVLVAIILGFILFPRRYELKDGGSVAYCSYGYGIIYQVENRNRIYIEGDYSYYEIGTVVYVFGIEVFNNAHVDYEHPSPLTRSPEVQEADRALDEYLTSKGF